MKKLQKINFKFLNPLNKNQNFKNKIKNLKMIIDPITIFPYLINPPSIKIDP